MKAALAKHPGGVISLEAEIEDGKPTYEFDIKGTDGKNGKSSAPPDRQAD